MRPSFLYGSFLTGHSASYGHLSNKSDWAAQHELEFLGKRFSERAIRFSGYNLTYGLALPAGLILALGIVLIAFRIPYNPTGGYTIVEVRQELVALEEIQQTRQELPPPAPPRPPVPIEVPNDVLLESEDLSLDAALDLDEALLDVQPPLPAPPPAEVVEEEPEIFVAVEQMPEMIGGVASLMKDVTYPEMARKASVEGSVIVQIVVDEEGMPRDPVILRSASELLDEAAVKAVMLQRFKPGRQRGRAVKVKMAIPVIFRLKTPETK
ncbi:MAG: TonB family protein [Rhodothermales bacterium]